MTVSSEALAATYRAAFPGSRPWAAQEFQELLAKDGAHLAGDAGAFALGLRALDELEILTVAVHPDRQRQGHGRRVVLALLQAANRAGARRAFLDVAADNEAALSLYRGLGFVESGRRKSYYARETGRVDAIVMSRDLTQGQPQDMAS